MNPVAPTVSPEALALALWLMAFLVLLNAANAAVSIWSKIKRRPPIDAEFARKDEVLFCQKHHAEEQSRIEQRQTAEAVVIKQNVAAFQEQQRISLERVHGRIDELKDAVQAGFHDIHRALGRLEGDRRE